MFTLACHKLQNYLTLLSVWYPNKKIKNSAISGRLVHHRERHLSAFARIINSCAYLPRPLFSTSQTVWQSYSPDLQNPLHFHSHWWSAVPSEYRFGPSCPTTVLQKQTTHIQTVILPQYIRWLTMSQKKTVRNRHKFKWTVNQRVPETTACWDLWVQSFTLNAEWTAMASSDRQTIRG